MQPVQEQSDIGKLQEQNRMGEFSNITQHPCQTKCGWSHPEGITYDPAGIYPDGICPFLYHSIYPYMLGLLYHADMQAIWACCPAVKSVNVRLYRETNGDKFPEIAPDWWVIYAKVEAAPDCPHGHKQGDRLLFPTYNKSRFMCPAGFNNAFYFLDLEIPHCIDTQKLRCPDWQEDVYYEVNMGETKAERYSRTYFCMNCGKTFTPCMDEAVIFCPHCGKEIDETI